MKEQEFYKSCKNFRKKTKNLKEKSNVIENSIQRLLKKLSSKQIRHWMLQIDGLIIYSRWSHGVRKNLILMVKPWINNLEYQRISTTLRSNCFCEILWNYSHISREAHLSQNPNIFEVIDKHKVNVVSDVLNVFKFNSKDVRTTLTDIMLVFLLFTLNLRDLHVNSSFPPERFPLSCDLNGFKFGVNWHLLPLGSF